MRTYSYRSAEPVRVVAGLCQLLGAPQLRTVSAKVRARATGQPIALFGPVILFSFSLKAFSEGWDKPGRDNPAQLANRGDVAGYSTR